METDQSNQKVILVVEDDASYRGPLVDELIYQGFSILEAENGTQGLQLALEKNPDVIILDIIMLEMDGMEMLDRLRAEPAGQHIPIILLTNLNPDDKILKGVVKNQPAYYLIKSETSLADVVEKVKSIV